MEDIEQLVIQAQAGRADAFAKLYDIFVNQIYRYVYFRVGGEETEDLTELIFLKILENIKQYRPGVRSFSSWIFRIAHNTVVDFYRSNHRHEELLEEIEDQRREANTLHRAHHHFDQALLTSAMHELPDHYRQIIILKYLNDLSHEEIAFIMGRSQAAIRILQFRALKNLRRILEKMGVKETDV